MHNVTFNSKLIIKPVFYFRCRLCTIRKKAHLMYIFFIPTKSTYPRIVNILFTIAAVLFYYYYFFLLLPPNLEYHKVENLRYNCRRNDWDWRRALSRGGAPLLGGSSSAGSSSYANMSYRTGNRTL